MQNLHNQHVIDWKLKRPFSQYLSITTDDFHFFMQWYLDPVRKPEDRIPRRIKEIVKNHKTQIVRFTRDKTIEQLRESYYDL